MKISIKNFEKNISKTFLTSGKNSFDTNKVREFDEESKNNFVAFVDDGAESFDVNIVLDDKQSIIKHSCDCKEEYLFCGHQIAVLYQLQLGAKTNAVKIPKAKKLTVIQKLLGTISHEALSHFLEVELSSNKIFELKFVQHFDAINNITLLADAIKNIETVKKTVVKNKKNIEKSELLQIVNLCNPILQSFINQRINQITKESAQDVFALIDAYINILKVFYINSNLLGKTIEKLVREKLFFLERVSEKSLLYSLKLLFLNEMIGVNGYFIINANVFVNYLEKVEKGDVADWLHLLKIHIRKISNDSVGFGRLQIILLVLVIEKELLQEFANDFYYMPSEESFNRELAQSFIDINDFESAEKICLLVIQKPNNIAGISNFYNMLIKIYTSQNNEAKLLPIQVELCAENPREELYSQIIPLLPNDEAKNNLRKKIMLQLEYKTHLIANEILYFKMIAELGNMHQLLIKLCNTKSLLHYITYFDSLLLENSKKLLTQLLERQKSHSWSAPLHEHKDENYYDQICKLVKENYLPSEFQKIYIQSNKYYKVKELGIYIRNVMLGTNQ